MSDRLSAHLVRSITVAGVPIVSVALGDHANKATWTVLPAELQEQAQPIIDAFNPNDPAHVAADLDEQVKAAMDQERLFSAIVWTIIDTYSAPATVTKYNTARTKVIAAYKATPWKP